MQTASLIACCWPGLARLWLRGEWRGLLEAVGFAVALNFLLVANFLRPGSLSSSWLTVLWTALGIAWVVATGLSVRRRPRWAGRTGVVGEAARRRAMEVTGESIEHSAGGTAGDSTGPLTADSTTDPVADLSEDSSATARGADEQDLFLLAQAEYLKGHWLEAEALIQQLLQDNAEDVDACLLLAGVFRRSGRLSRASQVLEEMQHYERAPKWRWEIEQERQRLAERIQEPREAA